MSYIIGAIKYLQSLYAYGITPAYAHPADRLLISACVSIHHFEVRELKETAANLAFAEAIAGAIKRKARTKKAATKSAPVKAATILRINRNCVCVFLLYVC